MKVRNKGHTVSDVKVYTIKEIAALTCRSEEETAERVKVGGLDFALSSCDTLAEFKSNHKN